MTVALPPNRVIRKPLTVPFFGGLDRIMAGLSAPLLGVSALGRHTSSRGGAIITHLGIHAWVRRFRGDPSTHMAGKPAYWHIGDCHRLDDDPLFFIRRHWVTIVGMHSPL